MASLRDPTRPRPPPPADDWALFLDVDGCLLDFAATPDGAVVDDALRDALARWSARLHGALALVSGRSLAVLDAMFAPLRLPAAGLHGLERRHGDLRVEARPAPRKLIEVRQAAQAIARKYPGTVVEDKGVALALHWRADPLAASDFGALAASAVMELSDYLLQHGDHVVELRPAGGNKGDAIAAFLDEPPFRGRLAVFAGDDLTDEHGFEVVDAHRGIGVLVGGREPSAAQYGLRDVADVRAWLGVAPSSTDHGAAV